MASWWKRLTLFPLGVLLQLSCSAVRSDVVGFDVACSQDPGRKVTVEGFVSSDTSTCSLDSSGVRECPFTIADTNRTRDILFSLVEGNGSNQVNTPEADMKEKPSITTFKVTSFQIIGDRGTVVDMSKKVFLSGKTTLLVSSTGKAVCRLDEATITQ
jgi:hypothetical protein